MDMTWEAALQCLEEFESRSRANLERIDLPHPADYDEHDPQSNDAFCADMEAAVEDYLSVLEDVAVDAEESISWHEGEIRRKQNEIQWLQDELDTDLIPELAEAKEEHGRAILYLEDEREFFARIIGY